jgi:nucleoid-associated protein YgaU
VRQKAYRKESMMPRAIAFVTVAAVLAALAGCNKKTSEPENMGMVRAPAYRPPAPPAETAEAPDPADDVAVARAEPVEPAEPPAAEPQPRPATRTYTIKKNDNYYALARRLLGNPRRWKEIAALNPGLDPHKLPIGKAILIPAE